jgi:hypothetical protein
VYACIYMCVLINAYFLLNISLFNISQEIEFVCQL